MLKTNVVSQGYWTVTLRTANVSIIITVAWIRALCSNVLFLLVAAVTPIEFTGSNSIGKAADY